MNSCLRMTIASLLLITIKIMSLMKAGDFYCYLANQDRKEVEENLEVVNSNNKSCGKIDQQEDLEIGQ